MSRTFGYESRANGKRMMLLDFWLTITRGTGRSDRPSVKVTAGYPELSRNERALNLKIELPIALFETPSLAASITVEQPEQAVQINTATIAEAVRSAIGMDVDIRVATPENEQ